MLVARIGFSCEASWRGRRLPTAWLLFPFNCPTWTTMKDFNDRNFGSRLTKATEARQAMLRRAERPAPDDPSVLKRKAEREAIAAAREARNEAKAREEADLAVALQAEQKAQRDARYAARKKRKA
jgi:hypothetical protein